MIGHTISPLFSDFLLFRRSLVKQDIISPEQKLHQLKAHFFLTLMSKFYSICDKGSRLNYFFNLGTYFHIGT